MELYALHEILSHLVRQVPEWTEVVYYLWNVPAYVITAELTGIIATKVFADASGHNDPTKVRTHQAYGALLLGAHFWQLSIYTAAGMCFLMAIRNWIFNRNSHPVWFWGYIVIAFVISVIACPGLLELQFSWYQLLHILPFAAGVLGAYAVWWDNAAVMRKLFKLAAWTWVVFGWLNILLFQTSYFGTICNMYRVWRLRKQQRQYDRPPSALSEAKKAPRPETVPAE